MMVLQSVQFLVQRCLTRIEMVQTRPELFRFSPAAVQASFLLVPAGLRFGSGSVWPFGTQSRFRSGTRW